MGSRVSVSRGDDLSLQSTPFSYQSATDNQIIMTTLSPQGCFTNLLQTAMLLICHYFYKNVHVSFKARCQSFDFRCDFSHLAQNSSLIFLKDTEIYELRFQNCVFIKALFLKVGFKTDKPYGPIGCNSGGALKCIFY